MKIQIYENSWLISLQDEGFGKLLEFALGKIQPPNKSTERKYNKFASSAVEVLTTNLVQINDFFFYSFPKSDRKIPKNDSHKELAEKCHESSFNENELLNNHNNDHSFAKTGAQKHDLFLKDGSLIRWSLDFRQWRSVPKRFGMFRLELSEFGTVISFHWWQEWSIPQSHSCSILRTNSRITYEQKLLVDSQFHLLKQTYFKKFAQQHWSVRIQSFDWESAQLLQRRW